MRVFGNPLKSLASPSGILSLKSSLKIVSTANREASNAAIQMTPGAKELKRDSCGPIAKGKNVTTIKKNTRGVI